VHLERPDPTALAHWRGVVLFLRRKRGVVREEALWTEHPFVREDIEMLLDQMEDRGEIERFLGSYRALIDPAHE
jgi:hypothetical protein